MTNPFEYYDHPRNRFHLYYDPDGNPISAEQWADMREHSDAPRVALTEIGDYWVSTIWLGLEQGIGAGPPLIYETMAFKGGDLEPVTDRRVYATREQAQAGHEEVVAQLRARANSAGGQG